MTVRQHYLRFIHEGVLSGVRIACAAFLATAVPAWVAQGQTSPHGQLSVQCDECHTSTSWKDIKRPVTYDHARAGFPLKGQHALVSCRACHVSLTFARTSNRCAGCHDDVHRGELGTLCDRCHTPQSWLVQDMVQKHARTRFALVGVHATASCQHCHTNQQKYEYVNVRTDCLGCHAADYQAASNPNHITAGFSTDCIQCHSITSITWGTGFDHARTGFTLLGAHLAVPCVQCHASGTFRGTSPECLSCHQKEYLAAANPRHAPGFSSDCASCHSSIAWRPANFNHGATAFPLTGAHTTVTCTSCHTAGTFAGTPNTCGSSACHLSNYNATANPAHAPAGFSLDCQICHTTTAWKPATFNHDPWFPISAGAKHSPGRWTSCVDCHSISTNYKTFSCITCHAHSNKPAVDADHSGRSGYTYTPTSCYSCHPRGVAG